MYCQCQKSSNTLAAFAETPIVSTTFFQIQRATTMALLRQSLRLRYQVFCLERGFLDAQDYPDHLEADCFDAGAVHLLARHKKGQTAGTARLVCHSAVGFPLQRHCRFDDPFAHLRDPTSPALRDYGEISRLAVSQFFRRRADDSFFGGKPRVVDADPVWQALVTPPAAPEIVTGLFKSVYHESKRLGITHWLVAMERSLDIMLRRMGFTFTPVGPVVDYCGPIRPYVAEIAAFERTLPTRHPRLLAYMVEGLPPALRPDWPRCAAAV